MSSCLAAMGSAAGVVGLGLRLGVNDTGRAVVQWGTGTVGDEGAAPGAAVGAVGGKRRRVEEQEVDCSKRARMCRDEVDGLGGVSRCVGSTEPPFGASCAEEMVSPSVGLLEASIGSNRYDVTRLGGLGWGGSIERVSGLEEITGVEEEDFSIESSLENGDDAVVPSPEVFGGAGQSGERSAKELEAAGILLDCNVQARVVQLGEEELMERGEEGGGNGSGDRSVAENEAAGVLADFSSMVRVDQLIPDEATDGVEGGIREEEWEGELEVDEGEEWDEGEDLEGEDMEDEGDEGEMEEDDTMMEEGEEKVWEEGEAGPSRRLTIRLGGVQVGSVPLPGGVSGVDGEKAKKPRKKRAPRVRPAETPLEAQYQGRIGAILGRGVPVIGSDKAIFINGRRFAYEKFDENLEFAAEKGDRYPLDTKATWLRLSNNMGNKGRSRGEEAEYWLKDGWTDELGSFYDASLYSHHWEVIWKLYRNPQSILDDWSAKGVESARLLDVLAVYRVLACVALDGQISLRDVRRLLAWAKANGLLQPSVVESGLMYAELISSEYIYPHEKHSQDNKRRTKADNVAERARLETEGKDHAGRKPRDFVKVKK